VAGEAGQKAKIFQNALALPGGAQQVESGSERLPAYTAMPRRLSAL